MIKFMFSIFIIGCVFVCGSRLLNNWFPSLAEKVAFETPLGPINWLLVATFVLCFGAYKMLLK